MAEHRLDDRRTMIDRDELKTLLAEVIEEKHTCVFTHDDTHDLHTLLEIYRETTSTFRRWVIRGVILAAFGALIFVAALKNGFMAK